MLAVICRTLVKLKEEVTILAISHQMAMRDVMSSTRSRTGWYEGRPEARRTHPCRRRPTGSPTDSHQSSSRSYPSVASTPG